LGGDMTVQSWGRFPNQPQTAHASSWRGDFPADLKAVVAQHGSTLPFGNGRSYGDSCLAASGHVVHTRLLNRWIHANWQTGLIRVESGMTLDELINISLPKGWFVPVTPGTKYVTLGGALANDVHGKNHHVRGSFGAHVTRFGLLRSDRGELVCSPTENADLFRASIAGLGLTGIMTWVELQLMPIQSSQMDVVTSRFNNLNEFFALSDEFEPTHEYAVAWIDCTTIGQGVFMAANHAPSGELKLNLRKKISVPITPPFSLMNRLSLKLLNTAYYRKHPVQRTHHQTSYEPYFYPLDAVLNWNRIYGTNGFQQFQCVIPNAVAHDAIVEILRVIAQTGMGSFLAVLKRCGDFPAAGLLSFPMAGVSLALDFAHNERLPALLQKLDAIVHQAHGRLYPAKDAHMSAAHFQNAYQNWPQLEALRDPVLNSRFWQRVTSS
jgi:FAD/FMN-containing dehydrogenase